MGQSVGTCAACFIIKLLFVSKIQNKDNSNTQKQEEKTRMGDIIIGHAKIIDDFHIDTINALFFVIQNIYISYRYSIKFGSV